ncbi:PKD domain-containing protein [Flexithrix dorotheae]|uniref:PKD domain-containing protein n=1 Tax=Flexithrix dorotheae TaxID=70993 RepID=UPI0003A30A4C|nr:PKD domain-containing protein [Flexithrix dorotheae]
MKSRLTKFNILSVTLAFSIFLFSCDSNDEPVIETNADFTVAANELKVDFTNTSTNGDSFIWDFGDGNTSEEESPSHTYAVRGEYEVILSVFGKDGETKEKVEALKLNVSNNLVKGGDMESGDASSWNVVYSGQKDADQNMVHVKYDFGFTNYKPTNAEGGVLYIHPDNDAVSPSEEGTIFYQSVDLTAGDYQLSALVKLAGEDKDNPTSAMNSYWFEFYVHDIEPTNGDGYGHTRVSGWFYGGWTGWELVVPPLDGPLPHDLVVGSLADEDGKFTLDKDGTYYIVFKMGKGWDTDGGSFGEGIALDNLTLVKIN